MLTLSKGNVESRLNGVNEDSHIKIVITNKKMNFLFLTFVVHVVIATPGRILDLMNKGVAQMGKCQMLVMDEVSN